MRGFALLALAGLTACVSPLDACVSRADEDLVGLAQAIEVARVNIDRGYAVERETERTTGVTFCASNTFGDKNTVFGTSFCNRDEFRTVERPVPLDIAAEQNKLEQMQERLPSARERRNRAVAQCFNQFGE